MKIKLPDLSLPEVLSRFNDLAEFWWVVSTQGGPFSADVVFNNEERHDAAFVDWPGMEDFSTYLLEKGTFPELAKYLVVDEWTYVAAFRADSESAALDHFKKCYIDMKNRCDGDGWEEGSDILMLYSDGWWEVSIKDDNLIREKRF